jgi:hypothetical protein
VQLKNQAMSKIMYLLDESGAIFIATSTSNNVAVLRTLPEMVMSASETTGSCSANESRRSLTL